QGEAAALALPALTTSIPAPAVHQPRRQDMNLKSLMLTVAVAAAASSLITAAPAFAQAKEQFFPVLSYRTGPYAPNGIPWADGYVDYLKLVNAQGGINGVKITFE